MFEGLESLLDYMIIKGENAAGPVSGKAETLELFINEAGVFFDEVMDVLVEGLAVEVEAGFTFLF